ncbi:MAG: hypothetical protein MHPSP_002880, partial [Paramarteilia canceri]
FIIGENFAVFLPAINSIFDFVGSDYALIYAYSKVFLKNSGNDDLKIDLHIDRRTDDWQEVTIMTTGINRLVFVFCSFYSI